MDFLEIKSQYKYKTNLEVRFCDIDLYGHVNNAIYLTYFEQARTKYWKEIISWDWDKTGIILAKAEVNYIKPITLNDTLTAYVKTSKIGNSSWEIDYALFTVTKNGEEVLNTGGKTIQVTFDYKIDKSIPIPALERQAMLDFDF
jgi:acyl-CoA thioester hydrolase